MPHQCVHCSIIYRDASSELVKGCSCGSHFVFFFKEKSPKEIQQETEELTKELTSEEKQEMEQDVREIIGDIDDSQPVILDFESVRVQSPGKFEVDLVSLFKGKPLIYRLEEGKYVIDIASTFQMENKKKK